MPGKDKAWAKLSDREKEISTRAINQKEFTVHIILALAEAINPFLDSARK
jgi:hypothetical protein